jgi:hypothetical protein
MTNDYERINFWKTEVEKLPSNTQQQKSQDIKTEQIKETEKTPVNEKFESA